MDSRDHEWTMLKRQVRDAILGKASPRDVENALDRHIRECDQSSDVRSSANLRVMLGELLLMTDRAEEAERCFRNALEYDRESLSAMLGMADSYVTCERLDEHERALNVVLDTARRLEDWPIYLAALDRMALMAVVRQDERSLATLQADMCDTFPRISQLTVVPLMFVGGLLEDNKGQLALLYLETALRLLVVAGSPGLLALVLRSAVEAYKQAGLSDEEMTRQLVSLAHDSAFAQEYVNMVQRAIERDNVRSHGNVGGGLFALYREPPFPTPPDR